MKLRQFISLCCIFVFCCFCSPLWGEQRDCDVSQFDNWNYGQLSREWIRLYKAYTLQDDSINMELSQSQWIGVLSRRAALHRQINERTSLIIESLESRISNHRQADIDMFSDTLKYASCVSDSAYTCNNAHIIVSLLASSVKNIDPFLADYLLSLVTPDMERYMPHSEMVLFNYMTLSVSNYRLALQDVYRASQRCVEYSKKAYAFHEDFVNFSSPKLQRDFLKTCCFMYEPLLVYRDAITLENSKKEWNKVSEFFETNELYCNDSALFQVYSNQEKSLISYPSKLLRNCIMATDWSYHDQFTDDAAMSQIKGEEKLFSTVSDNNYEKYCKYHRYKVFQVYMGQMTFDEACHAIDAYYDKVVIDSAQMRIDPSSFSNVIGDQIFVCDMSDLPFKEKHKKMLVYCSRLVDLLKYVAGNVDPGRISIIVNKYMNYARIYKYLTQEEQIQFFNSISAFTQVQTYVHNIMVGQLCNVILEEIIASRPELLVGEHGINSVGDLKKKAVRTELLGFMYNATLYYDLGKSTMSDVVNNYFRPLVPKERELLTLHPARGSQILKAAPKLTIYEDFVLGHHKWYNGKKGYPTWYDNTLSENRLLVDILTIADCMEAAVASPIRRSYTKTYSFDSYLEEMRKRSFTQFNPNVLSLIQENSDLKNRLRRMLEEDRITIYYSLYKDYFVHRKK